MADKPLGGALGALDALVRRLAAARTQVVRLAREGTPMRPNVPRPAPVPTPLAVKSPVAPRARPVVSAAAAEASLVTGLFASPQSLAAAFIAAEILAKPVALRDS